MKRSNVLMRRIFWLVIMLGAALVSQSGRCSEQVASLQKQAAAAGITIVDQNGRSVPNAAPSTTSQIFDVTVGPGGQTVFSPDTLNIAVGDTVRWTWASDNHSVSSGNPCAIDSQFCSPDDMNCPSGVLSNTGTIYLHTFAQAGSYSYFCAFHCNRGMTGTINVAAACTSPPANMVSWWPGDGNAVDIQGSQNGTLLNGATFAPGKVDQAFSFNGTSAYVRVPDSAALYPSGSFTVDAWIKTSQTTGTQQIINHYECGNFCPGGSAFSDYEMFVMDGKLSGFIRDTTGAGQALTGTTAIADGSFHHVAMQRDIAGGEMRLYLDGTLETSATLVPTGVLQNDDGEADPVLIGAIIENNNPGCGCPIQLFSGIIDEVEIFNRALSQTEIAAIFNAGSAGKCKAPQPIAAFSRKTHGAAGPFDIDLMPNASAGVECRSSAGGVYQMIVQFANPVTVAGATLSSGSGSVSGFGVNGAVVTVDLMNIATAQRIVVKLTSVDDGIRSGDVPVAMGVLIGDTNGNGSVNAGDVAQTKGQSGQSVTATNFREDLNANGSINAGDVALAKSQSGMSLP